MRPSAVQLIRETYLDVQREYLYWLEGSARGICVPVGEHGLAAIDDLHSVLLSDE